MMSKSYNKVAPAVNPPQTPPQARITWGGESVINRLDKLITGFYVNFSNSFLLERLEDFKKAAQDCRCDYPVEVGGRTFLIRQTGTRHANYVLMLGDVSILISRRKTLDQTPNVTLEIGSISSYSGYKLAVAEFKRVIHFEGGEFVGDEKVSRVDLCADFIGQDTRHIPLGPDHWVKQASKASDHYSMHSTGNKISGVSFGRSAIVFRLYDKVLELTNDKAKQVFFAKEWQKPLYDSSPVTRAEFQLRRDALKQFKIETIKDLEKGLQGIWDYLTETWVRLHEKIDRNGNEKRSPLHPFWAVVQAVRWCEGKAVSMVRHTKKKIKSALGLVPQMAGCAITLAAFDQVNISDLPGIIKNATDQMTQCLTSMFNFRTDHFMRKFLKKQIAIEAFA